jgi:hypothetical protein
MSPRNRFRTALIFLLFSIASSFFVNCSETHRETHEVINAENRSELTDVKINYEFDSLGLTLNSKIDPDFWRWDHMNSNNSQPDSVGIEHYENRRRPDFHYQEETTLPSLSITTIQNRITSFRATVIFIQEDKSPDAIIALLSELKMFDLLQDKEIRLDILDSGYYQHKTDLVDEKLILEIRDSTYSRMTYSIELIKK